MENTTNISYIIITAANSQFFELVQGTILSIREKPQGEAVIIGFLDLGCTEEQLKWLEEYVDEIKQPEWDFNFPNQETTPNYKKAYTARPFLPKYFPNFDVYIWLDADTWLQTWEPIELLIKGAVKREGLAIIPEISMGYKGCFPLGLFMVENKLTGGESTGWKQRNFSQYFGKEATQLIMGYPILNTGVIGLHKEAPHWQKWQEAIIKGINNCQASLFSDQSALMYAIYLDGLSLKTEFLPAWCNWLISLGFPLWDEEKECFVEPYLPNYPLGILHLSWTIKHIKSTLIKTLNNQEKITSFRYQSKQDTPVIPASIDSKFYLKGKINLNNQALFNVHRSGWNYAIYALRSLHNPQGILFDGFLERVFSWSIGGAIAQGLIPYQQPWLGIFHNPQNMPSWWYDEYDNSILQNILSRSVCQESLKHCLGLFALSEYHAQWLREATGKPVSVLYHPTEIPEKQFNFDNFVNNPQKKIIQIGWWLRKLHAIYQLPIRKDNPLNYEKIRLIPDLSKEVTNEPLKTIMGQKIDRFMEKEKQYEQIIISAQDQENTKELAHVSNEDYDQLLSENIVFIELYDASANNVVLECIARATPILVNPLPAVKEYLGEDYPFYFNTLEEAAMKALNLDLIRATHEYLKNQCATRNKLSAEYFLESFINSEVYQLTLNHELARSQINNTPEKIEKLAQENQPIVTTSLPQKPASLQELLTACIEKTKVNPNDFQAWFQLGNAFLINSQLKRAVKAYERAIFLNFDFPPAKEKLNLTLKVIKKISDLILSPPPRFQFSAKNIEKRQILPLNNQENRPFFSVMITTYQRTEFLERALTSVLDQALTPEEMEIEVINDGADQEIQDQIKKIVETVGKGRVKFYAHHNVQIPELFNVAIERARGNWLHILHDDDRVLPGFYEKLKQGIEQNNHLGAAFCRTIHVHNEFNTNYSEFSPLERETSGILENFLEKIAVYNRIQYCSIIVKREVYEQLGGFYPIFGDSADWEMWKRIAAFYPIYYEMVPLSEYYYNSSNETFNLLKINQNVESYLKVVEFSKSYLPPDQAELWSSQSQLFRSQFILNRAIKLLQTGQYQVGLFQLSQVLEYLPFPNCFMTEGAQQIRQILTKMIV